MSSHDLADTTAEAGPTEENDGELTSSRVADSTTPETPCPVVDSLEQIGSRWRLVVLHELLNGEARFNELKRETDANARTLSRVLDDLQETGFVNRRLEEDAPVATYYSLTAKGESLAPVFEEIDSWAHEWLAECKS